VTMTGMVTLIRSVDQQGPASARRDRDGAAIAGLVRPAYGRALLVVSKYVRRPGAGHVAPTRMPRAHWGFSPLPVDDSPSLCILPKQGKWPMERNRTAQLLAAGATGPVLFWLVVIVDGFTEPGYDARKAFISELALGKHGWVQTANFIVVGLLMLLFAVGLRGHFPSGRASLFGPL